MITHERRAVIMMTIEEAADRIGALVIYRPAGGNTPEFGTISEVRGGYVFVRYADGKDSPAKATRPEDLELV